MNKITFPLKQRMQGAEVANLQAALQLLLDKGAMLADDQGARRELSTANQWGQTRLMKMSERVVRSLHRPGWHVFF